MPAPKGPSKPKARNRPLTFGVPTTEYHFTGVRNFSVPEFERFLPLRAPQELAERLFELAMRGDERSPLTTLAIRLVVERLWPALRAVEMQIDDRRSLATREALDAKAVAAALPTATLKELRTLQKRIAEETGGAVESHEKLQ